MSYVALYRKYRPQLFEDLIGQDHISKTLQNAVKENKIAHAYLFCGPRGNGKTSTAKLLAKAVNCENSDNKPCGVCSSCIAIQEGTHPDVIEIDAASNNGVDEVRELIDKVKFSPIKGKYKVYIIDEVHMMSSGAFNALLKTLEEPPSHVIFILATTEPQKILPTIISRCQRFDFTKISDKNIIERLQAVLEREAIQYEDEAIQLIASLSGGGMRDALSILDQCLAYTQGHLTYKEVGDVYGVLSVSERIEFVKLLVYRQVESILNHIKNYDHQAIDIKRLTSDLIDIYKDVLIFNHTNNQNLLKVLNKQQVELLKGIMSNDLCFNSIDILIDTIQKYRSGVDVRLYFELACLKITQLNGMISSFDNVNNEIKEINYQEDYVDNQKNNEVILKNTKEEINIKNTIDDAYKGIQEVTKKHEISKSEHEDSSLEPQISKENNEDSDFIDQNVIHDKEISFETINDNKLLDEREEEVIVDPNQMILDIEQNDHEIEVDPSDVMNILVQAKKDALNEMQEKWPIISRYKSNVMMVKAASLLSEGMPVAAAENGVVIKYDHPSFVPTVNTTSNHLLIQKLFEEVFGRSIYFLAVTNHQWVDFRNQYLKLRSVNKLPKAKPIEISSEVNIVEEEDEMFSFAKKLFDEHLINEEE